MTRDAEHNYASIQGHMARGAAWMVAMRWSLRLVGLVNTVIIARLLTPADFGVATMAWIVVEFLMTLSEANVDLALLRGNRFSRAYLDTAWTVRLLCGIATTLALVAVAPLAAAYYHDERVEWVIRIIALRALVTGFENIGVLEFRRQLAFAKEYRFWMWRRVLMFGVGLALAFGFRDYRALAIAAPVSGLITVLVSYTMSAYRPRLCLTHWRELWAFSQWVILYNTARFLNGRVDQFVIGGIGTAADAGNYYVAYDTSGLPTREVIWPMGRAFTPTLAKIAHDPAEMRKALIGVLGVVAAIALPAGIGTSMVAEDTTLVLLGEQWTQSVEFFRWLAICGAFEAVLLAMETHFIAVG
ncbi:MAG: oligosaccharide flippase family protein, partial [Magnetospirillum sp.]|nr:oligosaccharide flippase family protein [Magnetospirillum sp.]